MDGGGRSGPLNFFKLRGARQHFWEETICKPRRENCGGEGSTKGRPGQGLKNKVNRPRISRIPEFPEFPQISIVHASLSEAGRSSIPAGMALTDINALITC